MSLVSLWEPVIPLPTLQPLTRMGQRPPAGCSQTLCLMIDSAVVSHLTEQRSQCTLSQSCLTGHCDRNGINLYLPLKSDLFMVPSVLFVPSLLLLTFTLTRSTKHGFIRSSNRWLDAAFISVALRFCLAGTLQTIFTYFTAWSKITFWKRHLYVLVFSSSDYWNIQSHWVNLVVASEVFMEFVFSQQLLLWTWNCIQHLYWASIFFRFFHMTCVQSNKFIFNDTLMSTIDFTGGYMEGKKLTVLSLFTLRRQNSVFSYLLV